MKKQLLEILSKSKIPYLQAYVSSPLLDEPVRFVKEGVAPTFHSASVGKMMTAVAIVRLIDQGLLDWNTSITEHLDNDIIQGLFTQSEDVTVEMLLNHTSGVNDYFRGRYSKKESFVDRVINQPNKRYKPSDLIHFTREYQQPIADPGQTFYYSDTGYVLLGLIAEKVYQQPLFQVFREEIFDPLGMKNTGLMFDDPMTDASSLSPVIVNKTDLREAASLSIDWAGGGLQTTLEDLHTFMVALFNHQLVTDSSLKRMMDPLHKFEAGMMYGTGMMELRFEQFFFLLKGLPRYYGHLGILGVHAWVEPQSKSVIVMNVSDTSKMVPSFRLLIRIVQLLHPRNRKQGKDEATHG